LVLKQHSKLAKIKHCSIIAANAYSWEKLANIPMALAFRYVREKIPHISKHIQDLSTIVASQINQDFLANGWTYAGLVSINTQVWQLVKPCVGINQLQESGAEAEHSEESVEETEHSEESVEETEHSEESVEETEHSEEPKSREEADFKRAYDIVLRLREDASLYSPKTLISNPKKRGTKDRDSGLTPLESHRAQVTKRQRTRNDGKFFKLLTFVFKEAL
jgi:hypothetical protein